MIFPCQIIHKWCSEYEFLMYLLKPSFVFQINKSPCLFQCVIVGETEAVKINFYVKRNWNYTITCKNIRGKLYLSFLRWYFYHILRWYLTLLNFTIQNSNHTKFQLEYALQNNIDIKRRRLKGKPARIYFEYKIQSIHGLILTIFLVW